MPVGSGKAHVIAHGFALDEFIGIVVLKRKWVFGTWTFVLDFRDIGKECHADEVPTSATNDKKFLCQLRVSATKGEILSQMVMKCQFFVSHGEESLPSAENALRSARNCWHVVC